MFKYLCEFEGIQMIPVYDNELQLCKKRADNMLLTMVAGYCVFISSASFPIAPNFLSCLIMKMKRMDNRSTVIDSMADKATYIAPGNVCTVTSYSFCRKVVEASEAIEIATDDKVKIFPYSSFSTHFESID